MSPAPADSATFPTIAGLHLGIPLALVAAFGVWWILERSKLGFEMRAVGANPDASRTAGMSIAKVYIAMMALAGLLAGLAVTMTVLGLRAVGHRPGRRVGRLRRDHRRAARSGDPARHGARRPALRRPVRRRPGHADLGGRAARADPGVQALIVLFVAAPALIRGLTRVRRRRKSGHCRAEGSSGMTDVIETPAAARDPEPQVRDRADVRRQIKLVVVLGLVLLAEIWFKLSIDDPTGPTCSRGARTKENQPVEFDGSVDLVGGRRSSPAIALVLALVNRFPRGWVGCSRRPRRTRLLRRVPDVGLRRPERRVRSRDDEPAPRHDPDRHRAGVRSARGRAVRARGRRQHRDRGPVHRRCLLRVGLLQLRGRVDRRHPALLVPGLRPPRRRPGRHGRRGDARRSSRSATTSTRWSSASCWSRSATASPASCSARSPSDREGRSSTTPQLLEAVEIPGLHGDPYIGEAALRRRTCSSTRCTCRCRWSGSCCSRPAGACGSGRSASTRRRPTRSASTSTGPGGRRCCSAACSPASGGASFTLSTGAFDKEMTAGYGFIALAAVIMGRWHPVWAAMAAADLRVPAATSRTS